MVMGVRSSSKSFILRSLVFLVFLMLVFKVPTVSYTESLFVDLKLVATTVGILKWLSVYMRNSLTIFHR